MVDGGDGGGVKSRNIILVIGLILIAANMRPSITCVGPLLDTIRDDAHLSGAAAGTLNTLPLLAFGGISAFVPRLARAIGLERGLFLAMLLIIAGVVVRSIPGTALLFFGTAVLGGGIACANVLVPSLVQRDFPRRVPVMTSLYATTMGLVAAVSSGVAIPIADSAAGGWRTALGCWALLGIVGVVAWLPQLRTTTAPLPAQGSESRRVWRSALGWHVTAFMGLQSFAFYVVVTWLPSILESHGYSATSAGFELFLFQLVSLVASSTVGSLLHQSDQRVVAAGISALGVIGFAGLAVLPQAAPLWIVIAGLGSGGGITVALSFFGLRTSDAAHAAALSGMAQSIGYLFAATGPVLIGFLHDSTSAWTVSLVVLVVVSLLQTGAGLAAGRGRTISAPAPLTQPTGQRADDQRSRST